MPMLSKLLTTLTPFVVSKLRPSSASCSSAGLQVGRGTGWCSREHPAKKAMNIARALPMSLRPLHMTVHQAT